MLKGFKLNKKNSIWFYASLSCKSPLPEYNFQFSAEMILLVIIKVRGLNIKVYINWDRGWETLLSFYWLRSKIKFNAVVIKAFEFWPKPTEIWQFTPFLFFFFVLNQYQPWLDNFLVWVFSTSMPNYYTQEEIKLNILDGQEVKVTTFCCSITKPNKFIIYEI